MNGSKVWWSTAQQTGLAPLHGCVFWCLPHNLGLQILPRGARKEFEGVEKAKFFSENGTALGRRDLDASSIDLKTSCSDSCTDSQGRSQGKKIHEGLTSARDSGSCCHMVFQSLEQHSQEGWLYTYLLSTPTEINDPKSKSQVCLQLCPEGWGWWKLK